jgi:hypothetical protein
VSKAAISIDLLFESNLKNSVEYSPENYLAIWQDFLASFSRGQKTFPESLLETISRQTHIAKENLRAGLKVSFEGLSHPIKKSLPSASAQIKKPVTAILASGNIPGVPLAPAILLAASGCPVVIKSSKNERAFMPWLLKAFRAAHPSFPERIFADYWESGGEQLKLLLSKADKILVFGANRTIEQLRGIYPGKVIGFGHKISFAYVDSADYQQQTGEKLALDVALFNQQGCLSVQALFVRGGGDRVKKWADEFTNSLSRCMQKFGAGAMTTQAKMRRNSTIEALQLQNVPFVRYEHEPGCVTVLPEFSPEYLIGNCFVEIIPVQSEKDVANQLKTFREYLQGIAVATDKANFIRLKKNFEQQGFSYVCEPARLQAPPLDWPNSGVVLPEGFLSPIR